MKYHFTLLFLLILSYGYSNPAEITSLHDYNVLENYFVRQFTNDALYYTLVGEKPITIYNDYNLDNFPLSLNHENSVPGFLNTVLLKQFLPIWEKLALKQDKFVLKSVPSTPGEKISLGYETMFINITSLKNVIEQNIILFKYVLGTTITVDDLVNRIAYSSEKLSESIAYNKILEGIVLGFGTHNSLLGGRLEQISALGFSKDVAPFSCKSNSLGEMKDVFVTLFLENASYNKTGIQSFEGDFDKLIPSNGFETIEQEISSIESLYEEHPEQLLQDPRFVFNAYKGDNSNTELFKKLIAAQKNAQEFLKQPNFLEQVLEKIHGEKITLNFEKKVTQSPFKESLDNDLWVEVIQKKAESYSDKLDKKRFLSSFLATNSDSQEKLNNKNVFVEAFNQGKFNFSNADQLFEKVSKDSSYKEIVPKKLYYKINSEGEGAELVKKKYVRLGYIVTNSNDQIFSANQECWINLTHCLPSFEHGLQGMKVGEEREIFIHPLLGYGIHTNLPLYTELKINVKLFEIDQSVSKPLSEIQSHSLEYLENPAFLEYLRKFDNLQNPKVDGSFYRRMFDTTEVQDRVKILETIQKWL